MPRLKLNLIILSSLSFKYIYLTTGNAPDTLLCAKVRIFLHMLMLFWIIIWRDINCTYNWFDANLSELRDRQPVLPAPLCLRSSVSRLLSPYSPTGPNPMHEVVLSAVRNAVSAATITFTASSIIRFFVIIYGFFLFFLRILGFKDKRIKESGGSSWDLKEELSPAKAKIPEIQNQSLNK